MFVNTHVHTRAQELPHACTYAGYNKKYRPGPQDTQRSDACIPIQHRPRVNNSRRVYTSGGVPGTRARLGGGLACLGCAAGGTPRRVRCQQCLAASKRGCKRAIRVAAIAWHAGVGGRLARRDLGRRLADATTARAFIHSVRAMQTAGQKHVRARALSSGALLRGRRRLRKKEWCAQSFPARFLVNAVLSQRLYRK